MHARGEDVFTAYVAALTHEHPAPDGQSFDTMWSALRVLLAREIRRRGLWQSPPSYLGVDGFQSWQDNAGNGAGGPLAELLPDCYLYAIVRRLRSLKEHLVRKPNIEGLVRLNVRNFVSERQRQHDPLGFRVYEVARMAVQDAVATGELEVLAGDDRIRNTTRLGWSRAPASYTPTTSLHALVGNWSDHLLPELVTAPPRELPTVLRQLRRLLAELERTGVTAFSFKDVVAPLKAEVRARWAALYAHEAMDETSVESTEARRVFAEMARLVRPDESFEQRQSFAALVDEVRLRIAHETTSPTTRRYLETLWGFLCTFAGDGHPDLAAGDSRPGLAAVDDELPSQRKVAELLQIPRARLPELYTRLRTLVHRGGATGGRP